MTYPGAALGSTLTVQTLASLVLTAPSVLAPAVAPTLGFGPERVGVFVGVAYLAAMLTGLRSGDWVARIGAVRLSQAAMLCCALGAIAAAAGEPLLLGLAALVIGAGYGVINPAAASLLARHAPVARHGLFFSVKQTGVPLGVALSGLLLPWGLRALGWRPSIIIAAAVCVSTALLMRPLIGKLEPRASATAARAVAPAASAVSASAAPAPAAPAPAAPAPAAPASAAPASAAPASAAPASAAPASAAPAPAPTVARRGARPGLMSVLRDPALRRLSLTSFTFAFAQLCFITFLVSYLSLELGQSLAAAAAVLAGTQAVSTLARIGWGYVADRWIDPGYLLGALGLAMAAGSASLALAGNAAAPSAAVLAAVLCAATTMGWNGVFFAELARRSTREEMAAVAGATQFFTFSGSMAGPVVFGEIIGRGASYSLAYAVLALLPAVAGIAMLRAVRLEAEPR